jgi:hypothetical protein
MQEESTFSGRSDRQRISDNETEDWSMNVYPISQKHGSGIPDSLLSQEEIEENGEAEEEWWDVPTNRHYSRATDDVESQMEAGDVDTTPDEEDPESDDSTDGEDDDPMPHWRKKMK